MGKSRFLPDVCVVAPVSITPSLVADNPNEEILALNIKDVPVPDWDEVAAAVPSKAEIKNDFPAFVRANVVAKHITPIAVATAIDAPADTDLGKMLENE